jgi:ATP-dependent metalloprotease
MRWFNRQNIQALEAEANLHTHDPQVQLRLMRELVRIEPEAAVARFESNRYASSEAVVKEYLAALVKLGRLDRANLGSLLRKAGVEASGAAGSAAPAAGGAAAAGYGGLGGLGALGTAQEPIQVVMAEPGLKSQIWRTLRFAGLSFLLFSAASALIEERGMPGGLSMNDKPEPVTDSKTRFTDVKGVDEAKAELQEVVAYLRDPGKFTRLGGKLPKGLLLVGPPGTGKTLLARAIAGEAGVPFFYASGSEFEEMFVGVGARRVRDLFAAAKKHSPCIIFIDEIDAIGGKRNPKDQSYMKMTLNQMLVELDGFEASEGIIVIGATNLPGSLDSALVRPGRFDRNVQVPNPDVEGRRQILELYLEKIPLAVGTKLLNIARGTAGFSGAELFNLVNMAALKAALDDKMEVGIAELEFAKDKILMGAERKSAVLTDESKRLTAYHEAGHAIMALYTDGATPIHKATIVPRGQALGMVSQLPDKDETSISMHQLFARLDVCMGGRVAEELIFGDRNVTSGASSDLDQATNVATAMVTKYGMNEKIGETASQPASQPGREA